MKIDVLDHGYVEFIESWGSDERIIEAARMSTNKDFKGWGKAECPKCGWTYEGVDAHAKSTCEGCGFVGVKFTDGDERLLGYLYLNKHSTPFEMAGLVIEVKAPIFVFRQWHRHRTQCLAPDTLVHFERQGKNGKRHIYKMRIEDVWKKWQPTVRKSRPERQTNALFKRSRIQGMSLRRMNEETQEIEHTSVVDVIKGEPKPMIRVTTASGRSIVATREHRFMTSHGWQTLESAIENNYLLTLEGTTRSKSERWEVPEIDEEDERWLPISGWEGRYEVSSWGRVRRINCKPKKNTVGANGYDVVSLSREGKSYAFTVHRLVLEAFVGPCPEGCETRHLNGNRADNRLENLKWGTAAQNSADRIRHDSQQRLVTNFEEIVSVEDAGAHETYDLSVEGPWHNFIADGFVVHNSYNEMSARYTPLPAEDYVPSVERLMVNSTKNKQAGKAKGAGDLNEAGASIVQDGIRNNYEAAERAYQGYLEAGVPKELARLVLPVARYSRMRASANLRNWLAFLTLRMDSHAQYEVRVYANAVGEFIKEKFPRTWELFVEGMNG